MTLYNLYRPESFEDMVGNESAIASIQKSLAKKNHSHVYLFSGPAGTGKTTAARIMAKVLEAGELDIREVNTASNRGIDTAREIMTQMRMLPMEGKSIVYILDEVHKWTNDMQNAMLKPLEDTPEHVYFMLCTTDPQKLIKAVRSRCTEIKFNSLPPETLTVILRRVNKLEKLNVSKESLLSIAEAADGSPRTALVLLEKVAGARDDKEVDEILKAGAFVEDPDTIELARALLNESSGWKAIASILKKLGEAGKLDDPEKVRYMVLGYMNSCLLSGKMIKRAAVAMEAFSEPTYNTGKFGITLACLNVVS